MRLVDVSGQDLGSELNSIRWGLKLGCHHKEIETSNLILGFSIVESGKGERHRQREEEEEGGGEAAAAYSHVCN